MLNYINHYTVNTEKNTISRPYEVNVRVFKKMQGIVEQVTKKKACELLDGIWMTLTADSNSYACTLFNGNPEQEEADPVLLTFGCKDKERGKALYSSLVKTYGRIIKIKEDLPCDVPYIIDAMTPATQTRMDILMWTGDFCRCLGWYMLEPEQILNSGNL